MQGSKPEEKITRLQDELGKVPVEAKPLLETVLGHWYWQYFRQNRYRFMQRTATAEPLGEDFTTWDLPRLYREIDLHFTNALADGRLKTIPTRDFADLLTKPTLPENYRPTLYDFIAHEALAFYTSGEFAAAKAEDAFEIKATDPVLDSLDKFLAWNPQTTDTASPHLKAVKLFQDVLRFHRTDSSLPPGWTPTSRGCFSGKAARSAKAPEIDSSRQSATWPKTSRGSSPPGHASTGPRR